MVALFSTVGLPSRGTANVVHILERRFESFGWGAVQELGSGLRSAIIIALGAVVFLGAVPDSTAVEIVRLESQRSLGDGQLAALLASSDEEIAARAALAIGRTKLEAGVPLLEAHLKDPRDAVRAFSIYGLGLIGQGSDATAIATAVRNDTSGAGQVAAIDALGRYEEAKRLDAKAETFAELMLVSVMDGVSRFTPDVRGKAAIGLGLLRRRRPKPMALPRSSTQRIG